MNSIMSFLGVAMLLLVSVAVILAVLILVLYETRWIVTICRQLSRSDSVADQRYRDLGSTRQQLGGE